MKTKQNVLNGYVDAINAYINNDLPQPTKKRGLYSVPSSPTSHLLMRSYNAGEHIEQLKWRNRSKAITIGVDVKKDCVEVHYKSNTAELTINQNNIVNNKILSRLLIFVLIQINDQCCHNGNLFKTTASFSLQELVDEHIYDSVQAAKVGIDIAAKSLLSIWLKGTIKKGRRNNSYQYATIFPVINVDAGVCTIEINKYAGPFFLTYFTILPDYCFNLHHKAFNLLYYIFFMGRMEKDKLKDKGYFTINLRELSNFLMLPSDKEIKDGNGNLLIEKTKNPKQKILDVIEKAVDEILSIHKEYYEFSVNDMNLQIIYPKGDNVNTVSKLDNGYIRVALCGHLSETFINISKKQSSIITARKNKKIAIENKSLNDNQ